MSLSLLSLNSVIPFIKRVTISDTDRAARIIYNKGARSSRQTTN